MVLQKQGVDSLFFGMGSGSKQSYLSSLNFWNALGMAYYANKRVIPEYDTFYNSLSEDSPGGLKDINTAITNSTVQDNLYYYLKKASNQSIPASAGLYFTLIEIIESQQKTLPSSEKTLSQSIGGGKPQKKKIIQNWPNDILI